MQRIISDYFEQLYVNKTDNLDGKISRNVQTSKAFLEQSGRNRKYE